MKRIFDFCFALICLFVSLPLWVIFGLAIWLEDRGPIFYLQERVGRSGAVFRGVKFRSMILGAETDSGPVQSCERDSRVTRLGRVLRSTAMDELPQLWNIIKGDMSFVGPRALRELEADGPENKLKYISEFRGFEERSRVSPGLTGIAQILAPRDIPRQDKFRYDIWYIRNKSFCLDMDIIVRSFLVTFMGKWETRQPRFRHLTASLYSKVSADILKDGFL